MLLVYLVLCESRNAVSLTSFFLYCGICLSHVSFVVKATSPCSILLYVDHQANPLSKIIWRFSVCFDCYKFTEMLGMEISFCSSYQRLAYNIR